MYLIYFYYLLHVKYKIFRNAKYCLNKSIEPSLYEERAHTLVDSIEFRWAQRKHLQRTGASTSLKSIVSFVYLYCGGLIHIPFMGQRFGCTGSLIREMLVAWGFK